MGQQPSKSAPVVTRTEAPLNEKRAYTGSTTVSEAKLAAYSQSTDASAGLSLDKLEAWQHDFDNVSILYPIRFLQSFLLNLPLLQSPVKQLSQLVLSNAHPTQSLIGRSALIADQQIFNLELKGIKQKDGSKGLYPGPVTNQKMSGRCWLFATSMSC